MTDADSKPDSDWLRTWRQGPAGHVQLNRPEKANAYNRAMLDALALHVREMAENPGVRVVILSGAGERAFCAGADLDEMTGKDWSAALNLKSAEVFSQISRLPVVTLAAINGAAVAGGLELALACDVRIAVESARFSFPETGLGLIPAAGGTQRLAQIVGQGRAKEMILGGRTWSATEALNFGLLSEVTTPDDLMPTVQQWAERIAGRDPLATRLAKEAIDLDGTPGAGYSFEAVAEALLYQLRLRK